MRNRVEQIVFIQILSILLAGPVNAADLSRSSTQLRYHDLYLESTLNGNPVGLVHMLDIDGKLYSSDDTLRHLGFRIPSGSVKPRSLDSLPYLKYVYNPHLQTLALVAPLDTLDLNTTQINPSLENEPKTDSSRGVLLNYDLYTQRGVRSDINTFSELRAFNSAGVMSTTQLSKYSTGQNSENKFSRLDSSWRKSWPDRMVSLTIGDTISSSLSWSRPTRIAGIQFGTDFNLKPYMPTAPLPAFIGSATLPSSIELYVNGIKSYSGKVQAGNFQLNTIPNISGAGNAQLMMYDALGRTTTQNFSFYNDQSLLREGLSSWSTELGVIRENYGNTSFDYASSPVLSATWRRGISNSFTISTHAEAGDNLVNGGFGGDWIPENQCGTFSSSLALSSDAGDYGYQHSIGYRWNGENFNFSTERSSTSGNYRDVASRYGLPPPTLSSSTVVGYNFGSAGNLSLGYLQLRYPNEPNVRYANVGWFKAVTESVSINAGFNRNVDDERDKSIYLMMTVSSRDKVNISSTIQRTNGELGYQLNAGHTPSSNGGTGWNFTGSQQGSVQSGNGELNYLGRYGNAYTGFRSEEGVKYGYAGAAGSIVIMGGGLFAAQQINDGFAVVSTDGIPGVPIKLQNNLVGISDSHGLLLVPQLTSYQKNEISIDPMGLPANTRISRVTANATPSDRSGTFINFDITRVRAAQVILVDGHGQIIPQGSVATLVGGTHQSSEVGYDGLAYFDTLNNHNTIKVVTETGNCIAEFDAPEKADGIDNIGPVICK